MRVCHGFTAVFDDPNLVPCAGLAPALQLAERAGLQRLVGENVELGKAGGVHPHLKIPALVVGMVARADSTDDMALLPGSDELAYVDVDDTLRRTYGYAKQGAGRGYTGVKGLNALLAIVSTPSAAPGAPGVGAYVSTERAGRRRARCGAAGGGAGGASVEQLRGRDGVGQRDGRVNTGG